MSNVYYGVCDSAANDAIKIVNMLEDSSLSSINDLRIGDLFAIYFKDNNTASSITIKLTSDVGNQDDNENDAGLVVKTMNVEEDCADLWHKGEAVIFVCSAINENSEVNTGQDGGDQLPNAPDAYLRLLDSGKASTDIYGATTIWEEPDSPLTLEQVINQTKQEGFNENTALAPWILELIYERLGRSVQIAYDPEDDATAVPLGTLTATYSDGTESSFTITAPAQAKIRRTSELINDGDNENETPNGYIINVTYEPVGAEDTFDPSTTTYYTYNTEIEKYTVVTNPQEEDKESYFTKNEDKQPKEDGKFFITNTPAKEIYFTGDGKENDKTGGIPAYLFKRTQSGDIPLLGGNATATKLYGNTIDLGDVTKVTNAGAISTASLTASGDIVSTNGSLKTETQNIYEKNQALNTRYSGKLSVTPHLFQYNNKDYLTLNSGQSFTDPHPTCTFTRPGYRCLGIVGHNYNLQNNTKDARADASYVREWELFPISFDDLNSSVTIQMDITNASTAKQINVKLYVYLLWEKKID